MRNSENYLPKTGPAKTGPAGPLATAMYIAVATQVIGSDDS